MRQINPLKRVWIRYVTLLILFLLSVIFIYQGNSQLAEMNGKSNEMVKYYKTILPNSKLKDFSFNDRIF